LALKSLLFVALFVSLSIAMARGGFHVLVGVLHVVEEAEHWRAIGMTSSELCDVEEVLGRAPTDHPFVQLGEEISIATVCNDLALPVGDEVFVLGMECATDEGMLSWHFFPPLLWRAAGLKEARAFTA
jgi:hypothetical protein